MTVEQMRAMCDATPFRPFVIHLADGKEIPVVSREFISSAPTGRTIVVWQPDDSMSIIDLLLVTRLEQKSTDNGKSNGNGQGQHKRRRK
jgi:hypothetical protein